MKYTNEDRIDGVSKRLRKEVEDISWDAFVAGYIAGAREGDADIEDISKRHAVWLRQHVQP